MTVTLNLLLSTLIRIRLPSARARPSTVDISRRRSLHLTRPSRSVNSFHTLSGVALMALVSVTCVMDESLPQLDF